jgi:hypothetical protein
MAMFYDESSVGPSRGSSDLSLNKIVAESTGSLHENPHKALISFCFLDDSSKLGQNASEENEISKSIVYLFNFFLDSSVCFPDSHL